MGKGPWKNKHPLSILMKTYDTPPNKDCGNLMSDPDTLLKKVMYTVIPNHYRNIGLLDGIDKLIKTYTFKPFCSHRPYTVHFTFVYDGMGIRLLKFTE